MSVIKEIGKDKVIFVTKEDHAEKSKIELPPSEPAPGLLLPSGSTNIFYSFWQQKILSLKKFH